VAILITGVAGFVGYHVSEALLARRETVIGIDQLNAYYDVRLKQARLDRLLGRDGFSFTRLDIADRAAMEALAAAHPGIDRIVHLAAQAGVRYSLEAPHAYVQANVVGHLNVLELARRLVRLEHLVYASSSSVYGANDALPFAETDRELA
jgi:UDP-glucuronate 4-epimerase